MAHLIDLWAKASTMVLATDSFYTEINVAANGTIYIVWINGISPAPSLECSFHRWRGQLLWRRLPPRG